MVLDYSHPLGLSAQEVDNLVEFLNSLTGSNVDMLISDAFAARVGDVTHYDMYETHSRETKDKPNC